MQTGAEGSHMAERDADFLGSVDLRQELARELKEARKRATVSQTRLAEAVGFSSGTVTRPRQATLTWAVPSGKPWTTPS